MKLTSIQCLLLLCFITGSAIAAEPEHPPEGYGTGIELPAGAGRELLEVACTRCHDLRGLQAYQGYWNRRRWTTMVETMMRNGAVLEPDQKLQVIDYLTLFFGPGTRPAPEPE